MPTISLKVFRCALSFGCHAALCVEFEFVRLLHDAAFSESRGHVSHTIEFLA